MTDKTREKEISQNEIEPDDPERSIYQRSMTGSPQREEVIEKAELLLNALYHNPEHIGLIAAERPAMPTQATRRAWDALLTSAGEGFDTSEISRELRGGPGAELLSRIRSERVAGLMETTRHAMDTAEMERWAAQLRDSGQREELSRKLAQMAQRLRETNATAQEAGAHVMRIVQDILRRGRGASTMQHIAEAVEEAMEEADAMAAGEDLTFINTGFFSLDDTIGGIPVGELTIVAAHSGMGKTSFLLQLVRQMARIEASREERTGAPQRAVILFSIEMSASQCVWRCAAAEAQVNLQQLRADLKMTSELPEDHPERAGALGDLRRVKEAARGLKDLPIYIDADPEPALAQITSRVMQVQAAQRARGCEEGEEIAVIGVDYDEKVNAGEHGSEELRVSAISKGLKVLGKQFRAASVALSQYKSAPTDEMRPGTDSDLRYSRKKHHEAHTILHWWWPRYFVVKGRLSEEVAAAKVEGYKPHNPAWGKMMCTKNRTGSTGTCALHFEPEHTRFSDPNAPKV